MSWRLVGQIQLDQAVAVLRKGRLVVYPTETLYGLGGDPRQSGVVERIVAVKRRRPDQPFPLLLPLHHELGRYVQSVAGLDLLIAAYWPGALTLVLPAVSGIPAAWTQGSGWLGVRRSADPVAQALLRALDGPLVATSANISGGADPRSADDLVPEIRKGVDIVLDAGPRPLGRASTVLQGTENGWRLLRAGAIAASEIGELLGQPL